MPSTSTKSDTIDVIEMKQGAMTVCLLGKSPYICHAMSQKAQRELLLPRGRKTAAEKKTMLKHDPLTEYRDSIYARLGAGPTRIVVPATQFKQAMMNAALDMPTGATKAALGRLTWVVSDRIDIYGVPQLLMSVVRSADMAKTPDIRTRAILPEWAVVLTIEFVEPVLTAQTVSSLLAAAGMIMGVGDWRQQKGKGNFGQFKLVDQSDEDFQRVVASGGMAAQDAALAEPTSYDSETEHLLSWYLEEVGRRGAVTTTALANALAEAAE